MKRNPRNECFEGNPVISFSAEADDLGPFVRDAENLLIRLNGIIGMLSVMQE